MNGSAEHMLSTHERAPCFLQTVRQFFQAPEIQRKHLMRARVSFDSAHLTDWCRLPYVTGPRQKWSASKRDCWGGCSFVLLGILFCAGFKSL